MAVHSVGRAAGGPSSPTCCEESGPRCKAAGPALAACRSAPACPAPCSPPAALPPGSAGAARPPAGSAHQGKPLPRGLGCPRLLQQRPPPRCQHQQPQEQPQPGRPRTHPPSARSSCLLPPPRSSAASRRRHPGHPPAPLPPPCARLRQRWVGVCVGGGGKGVRRKQRPSAHPHAKWTEWTPPYKDGGTLQRPPSVAAHPCSKRGQRCLRT